MPDYVKLICELSRPEGIDIPAIRGFRMTGT